MARKVIRRSIEVRHSARPRTAAAPAGGFFAMLSRLSEASDRLERARPRRRS